MGFKAIDKILYTINPILTLHTFAMALVASLTTNGLSAMTFCMAIHVPQRKKYFGDPLTFLLVSFVVSSRI